VSVCPKGDNKQGEIINITFQDKIIVLAPEIVNSSRRREGMEEWFRRKEMGREGRHILSRELNTMTVGNVQEGKK